MNHVILLSSLQVHIVSFVGHKGGRMQHYSGLLEQLRYATSQIEALETFHERCKHLLRHSTFHVTI